MVRIEKSKTQQNAHNLTGRRFPSIKSIALLLLANVMKQLQEAFKQIKTTYPYTRTYEIKVATNLCSMNEWGWAD